MIPMYRLRLHGLYGLYGPRGPLSAERPLTLITGVCVCVEGGILNSPCPSVRPSVCPSVCRRHGFRSVTQVCFGISISNFISMFFVAMDRSLFIFSDVTFKMTAWQPYWIFQFPH